MLMWYSICDCLDIFPLNIPEAAAFTSACPSILCWISSSQFSTVLSTVVKTSVVGCFNTEWPALIIQKLAFINSSSMRLSLVCEWWREETSRLPLHSGSAGAPFSILCSFSSNKRTLLHLGTRNCHFTLWWQICKADVTCLCGKSEIDKLTGNSELTHCISWGGLAERKCLTALCQLSHCKLKYSFFPFTAWWKWEMLNCYSLKSWPVI